MHSGGGKGGGGGYETAPPPRQIFKKLVNKNEIKCKIGGPPQAIFPETLDPPPPYEFWQKLQVPPPPWIFNPCASMVTEPFLLTSFGNQIKLPLSSRISI